MVHSAMQYTDFTKALFTFKVLNGFMVNVNAISHMPIREVWLAFHVPLIMKCILSSILCKSHTEFHPHQIINMPSTTVNSMLPSNKVSFYCADFY
jgi:hypothetical protein